MIYLFEYNNRFYYGNASQTDALERFMQLIWRKRKTNFLFDKSYIFSDANKIGKVTQAFLNIDRNNYIQAKNYIGMLQFEGKSLHFLPKLFYTKNEKSYDLIAQMSQIHLIWWLSYAQKMHFPIALNRLDSFVKNDFNLNEVLIFHFAQFCLQKLSQEMYQDFHSSQKANNYVKGKIITHLYICKHISKSEFQIIPCKYATHSHINLFNIIIKNVCLRLLHITNLQKTKSILDKIIHHFHFLPIQNIRLQDCEKVKINPIFKDWHIILDYCKMFLSNTQSIEIDAKKRNRYAMAFLVPTDILFEQFVYGFLKKHFPKQKVIYQENSTFLATDAQKRPVFRLKQDIIIEKENGSLVILDTKYKLIDIENGVSKGVLPTDLYQITTYAVRRKCKEVVLLYPSLFSDFSNNTSFLNANNFSVYHTKEEFSQTEIKISIVKIPFAISPSVFKHLPSVSQQFEALETILKKLFTQLLFK